MKCIKLFFNCWMNKIIKIQLSNNCYYIFKTMRCNDNYTVKKLTTSNTSLLTKGKNEHNTGHSQLDNIKNKYQKYKEPNSQI